MSEKEQLLQLIDNMPDYKIGYILAYAKGITAEEQADNYSSSSSSSREYELV